MTKDSILQVLDINKEIIKSAFNIDDSGVNSIRKFLNDTHKDFQDVVNSIFISDMGNREKMVLSYLIGYDNGIRQKMINGNKRKS